MKAKFKSNLKDVESCAAVAGVEDYLTFDEEVMDDEIEGAMIITSIDGEVCNVMRVIGVMVSAGNHTLVEAS